MNQLWLLEWGTQSLRIASIEFILFTIGFFVAVRWWRDLLGRTIAGVVGPVAAILAVSLLYQWGVPIPEIIWVRAVLYTVFAGAMGMALLVFLWAQFIAPRIKRRRNR